MDNESGKEDIIMDHKHDELSLEELKQARGGNNLTVKSRGAEIHAGPGRNYAHIGFVSGGNTVFFTQTVTYNDAENTSWYQISSPASGWVRKQDLLV